MMTIPVPVMGCPLGTEVMIVGLTRNHRFNGLTGVVQSIDREQDQYYIMWAPHTLLKVKRKNLQMQVPVITTGIRGTSATTHIAAQLLFRRNLRLVLPSGALLDDTAMLLSDCLPPYNTESETKPEKAPNEEPPTESEKAPNEEPPAKKPRTEPAASASDDPYEKDKKEKMRSTQTLVLKRENLQMLVPVIKTGIWMTPTTKLNLDEDRYVIPLTPSITMWQ